MIEYWKLHFSGIKNISKSPKNYQTLLFVESIMNETTHILQENSSFQLKLKNWKNVFPIFVESLNLDRGQNCIRRVWKKIFLHKDIWLLNGNTFFFKFKVNARKMLMLMEGHEPFLAKVQLLPKKRFFICCKKISFD